MLVEREIGHEPFQPAVLVLPPAAAGGVRSCPDARTSFPGVEGRVADAELPTEGADRGQLSACRMV